MPGSKNGNTHTALLWDDPGHGFDQDQLLYQALNPHVNSMRSVINNQRNPKKAQIMLVDKQALVSSARVWLSRNFYNAIVNSILPQLATIVLRFRRHDLTAPAQEIGACAQRLTGRLPGASMIA